MSLWQKTEPERPSSAPTAPTAPTAENEKTTSTASARPAPPAPQREVRSDQVVKIGQSIEIKGELTGNEDLTIDGRVEGRIDLKEQNLTIGNNGRIVADVHAKNVFVVGEVTGDIVASDKIEIGASGSVEGDLTAPRVILSDGASFKGSIDMNRSSSPKASANAPSPSTSVPSPTPTTTTTTATSTPAMNPMPRSAAGK